MLDFYFTGTTNTGINTYSDGFKVIGTILRLFRTYRPMNFFGILAAVLAVLGVAFLIPVLIQFNQTGLVAKFPTLIVCCFVILSALISLFSGVLLETMTWKNKQDFEMWLHRVHEDKMEKLARESRGKAPADR